MGNMGKYWTEDTCHLILIYMCLSIQGVPFFDFIVGNASIKFSCYLYMQGFYILTVGRTNRLASLVLTDLTYCSTVFP